MKNTYEGMRKMRPDGNCFFRAFAFAYFESLLNDFPERDRFADIGLKFKHNLVDLGFSGFTIDEFYDYVSRYQCLDHKSDLKVSP